MSRLEIKRFTSRMLGANTYVLYADGEGVIIDPCTKVGFVKEFCSSNEIKINFIIMTHCHIDHTLYIEEYKSEFNAVSMIHDSGNRFLQDENLNGARLFGMNKSFGPADKMLSDGDEINVGTHILKVMFTPGHSPGSICIKSDNILICGDTLFNLSIGRSDLPGGDPEALKESLEKLKTLPDDTIIYPGHGTFSTMKFEKENNPYLSGTYII